MKKIAFVFFITISTFILAQDGIQFQNLTFKEILSKAKAEKKLVFLDAYAAWCGPCKLMDKNVFTLKTVGDYYNANFINAKIDMEKGEGRDIAKKYSVYSYPTYLFLNGDGEVVAKNLGYMEENEFISAGKDANNPNNRGLSMKQRLEKGEKDPAFLMNIIRTNANTDFDLAKKASQLYFENRKKDEPLSQDEIRILFYFTKSVDDPQYKFLTSQKAEILKMVPEAEYNQFNNQLQLMKIMENAVDKKTNALNEKYFLEKATPILGQEEASNKLNQLKLAYYEQTGNFVEFEKTALEYYKNADQFDPNELLKAAWIFSDSITNPKSLNKAVEWAQKSVMRGETAENTYILAKLYLAVGKKDLAKGYAELSKNITTQSKKDSTLIDEFLKNF